MTQISAVELSLGTALFLLFILMVIACLSGVWKETMRSSSVICGGCGVVHEHDVCPVCGHHADDEDWDA